MKLLTLYNQFKITVLISVILFAIIGHSIKTSEKVAVIFSGHEFHHNGAKLRESLLEKNYDVHLTQVHGEQLFYIHDWSKTPLGKALDGHYKQLLLIVNAHGYEYNGGGGAQIYWDSFFELIKLFEQKADEVFIHIEACFSGNAAERWFPQLGNNVKVLTTSSCPKKSSVFNPFFMDNWGLTAQIFTGYYLSIDNLKPSANQSAFEKLTCNSTVSDLANVMYAPCTATTHVGGEQCCSKLHIWRGQNEQIDKWDILPINLTVKKVTKLTHVEFPGHKNCGIEQKPFDHKRVVQFNHALPLIFDSKTVGLQETLVNTLDPIKAWKLRTYNMPIKNKSGQYYFHPVPKEFKENNIAPYSTILEINDTCNAEKDPCNREQGELLLKNVHNLSLGYYDTREIWNLGNNEHFPYPTPHDPEQPATDYTTIIVVCVVVVLGIAIGAFVFFCYCKKKKHLPVRKDLPNARILAPVEIHTPLQFHQTPNSTTTLDIASN